MTGTGSLPSDPFDPVGLEGVVVREPDPPVWYKRTWVLVAAAVAVVVAASVVVDLPGKTTIAQDTAAQTSLMNEINGDISGCAYAVRETFLIYQDSRTGGLTASDRSRVPSLLRDDQTACSFTNSAIYDLANVEVPGSPAGKSIQQVVSVDTLWATSDALAAIEDVQSLNADRGTASTIADLAKQEAMLAKDRALANGYVEAAEKTLGGAKLPMTNLPDLPHLVGT
jgi:hypothetical protein